MTALSGTGAAPGRARGPVVRLSERVGEPVRDPIEALRLVADELEALADSLRGDGAEILRAQALMARDPELLSAVAADAARGAAPESAVAAAFAPFRAALTGAGSDYQRARVDDIDDLIRRTAAVVEGRQQRDRRPAVAGILVGETLSAADTAAVPAAELLGIVAGDGSPTSHAAILARALGVPAVVGAEAAVRELEPGDWIEIDGDSGGIARVADHDGVRPASSGRRVLESVVTTRDGHPIDIRANIGTLGEADVAREVGLTSSGLVRTEFLFAARDSAPSVSEQAAAYGAILDRLPGEVVVRALDAGFDKPLAYLPQAASPNPALGARGIRLLLRHPHLLADQIRALCRCGAAERVRLMLPMVSWRSELTAAREIARGVFAAEGVELALGAMIEVPIAALAVDALAPDADFLSVGTNDLLQYLYASDRATLGDHAEDEPPAAVWRLLGDVFATAAAAGRPVGVCGELAGDPRWAGVLWALGATSLSMAPGRAPAVADALRERSAAEWRSLADALRDGVTK